LLAPCTGDAAARPAPVSLRCRGGACGHRPPAWHPTNAVAPWRILMPQRDSRALPSAPSNAPVRPAKAGADPADSEARDAALPQESKNPKDSKDSKDSLKLLMP